MWRGILFLFMVATSAGVAAQCGINIPLRELMKQKPDETLGLYVHCDNEAEQYILNLGGTIQYRAGKYLSIRIATNKIELLANCRGVKRIEYQLSKPVVLNDTNRRINNVDSAFYGYAPLNLPLDGSNVLMGIIDGGIDFNHGDFKNADGSTRVLRMWNQFEPFDPGRTPPKYGYGQVWDSTDINTGTALVTGQYLDHGCTVTGTAAGNAGQNGYHRGVAPATDLIIVSSDFNQTNWLQSVADAVDYIVSVADSLQRPVVINASLGDYLGSHDGKDPAALYIDSLLAAKPGRIMVCAAGNSGSAGRYHLNYQVTADTAFTWFQHNPSMALGPGVFMEIWADTADLRQVEFSVAADMVNPSYKRRGKTAFYAPADCDQITQYDTIFNTAGDTLATVQFYSEERGGQRVYQIYIPEPDSNSTDYRFALMATGTGAFDLWSAAWLGLNFMDTVVPAPVDFPQIINYRAPDDRKIIVSSWACSPNVITVGNMNGYLSYTDYNNNLQVLPGAHGKISKNSSYGPTRDLLTKPDIAATGDVTFSAGSMGLLANYQTTAPHVLAPGGMHVRNGGTSMASPVVAGAAALYLQKCPLGTPAEFKQLITSTARQDAYTGSIPNDTFGYGKIDVFKALVQSNFYPSVSGDTVICQPGTVTMMPNQSYSTIIWNETDTAAFIQLTQQDTIWYIAENSFGCRGYSDTVVVHDFFAPYGTVTVSPDSLSGIYSAVLEIFPDTALHYTLYDVDSGVPVLVYSGTSNYWEIDQCFGMYTAEIEYANGCTGTSDTMWYICENITEVPINPVSVYPNPSEGWVSVSGVKHPVLFELSDFSGRRVWSDIHSTDFVLDMPFSAGTYFLRAVSPGGVQVIKLVLH
jgi:hypothetical protein